MVGVVLRWALAGALVAGLGGCYSPRANIAADAMGTEDTATYLVLTDQLQRVRNVLKKPAKVCLGVFPEGQSRGLAPVPDHIVERIASEQSGIEPKLELVANVECLVHYVRDKAYFEPESSDTLAYAGTLPSYANRQCGDWFGGLYNQANIDREVEYDMEVEDGVARLTGGEDCRRIRWYRS
ncbi:MAG: hypothetical protein JNN33_03300 [Rhodospirillaceae bacterium]|jgi:hypothetical protein|nr:hypothetical protein [Rhodospirillaceae bacterium]